LAFENDATNKGIIRTKNAFVLSLNFPYLKSTPRLACAFIIRLASSNNVGINLNAIEIIIVIISVGIFISFKGYKISLIALVNKMGFVEIVKIVVVKITPYILKKIEAVLIKLNLVNWKTLFPPNGAQ